MSAKVIKMIDYEIFNEMNLLRRFPREYAKFLDKMSHFFKDKEFDMPGYERVETVEGVKAVIEAAKVLREGPETIPPFSDMPEGLCRAAEQHVKDTGKAGTRSHVGTDNSLPTDRIRENGGWYKNAAENLDFSSTHAREVVTRLLIDDGIDDRGHRKNLLNPEFRVVGVNHGPHSKTGTMTCIVFTSEFGESAIEKMKLDLNLTRVTGDQAKPVLNELMSSARTNHKGDESTNSSRTNSARTNSAKTNSARTNRNGEEKKK